MIGGAVVGFVVGCILVKMGKVDVTVLIWTPVAGAMIGSFVCDLIDDSHRKDDSREDESHQ